jgi:tetratricopeptide (TPR) repeat protein
MRPRLVLGALVLALLGTTWTASADDAKKGYTEEIKKGQSAFVSRDLAGAVAAFQSAIKIDGEALLGFLRLGEAQLESGKLDEAEQAWTTALNKKGSQDDRGKVLFVMADLRERQKKWQAAKDAWNGYLAFLQANPKVHGYPASATERIKQVERRMKDEVDYGAVKDRIAKRIKDKEAEAVENAKKDKQNR